MILILNVLFGVNALIINNIVLIAVTYSFYLWLGGLDSIGKKQKPLKKKSNIALVLEQNPIRSIALILLIIMAMAIFSLVIPIHFVGTFLFGFIALGFVIVDYFKYKQLNFYHIMISLVLFILWIASDFIYANIVYGQVISPGNVEFDYFLVFIIFFSILYLCVIYSGVLMVRKSDKFTFYLGERAYRKSIESLVFGLFLGLPWAVASFLNNSFLYKTIEYYWWEPLMIVLPRSIGTFDLHETLWALLFLLPLSYNILKSNFEEKESISGAIIFVSIFTITFRYPVLFWFKSFFYIFLFTLSYGLPQTYLFAKRGFETVVGFALVGELVPIILILFNII